MKKQLLTIALMLVAFVAASQSRILNRLDEIDLKNHSKYVPKDFELKSSDGGVYLYENKSKQFIAFVFDQDILQCVRTADPNLVIDQKKHKLQFTDLNIDGKIVEVVWRRGRLIVRQDGKWHFYTQSFIRKQQ